MAYRLTTIKTVVADDIELARKFYEGACVTYQTLDQEVVVKRVRVGTSDSDTAVDITPITSGKYVEIRSDYPVRVRINGVGATQFTLNGQGVAAVAQGAPMPDKCAFVAHIDVTSVYLQPIASAAQTANVTLILTGDPVSVYSGG